VQAVVVARQAAVASFDARAGAHEEVQAGGQDLLDVAPRWLVDGHQVALRCVGLGQQAAGKRRQSRPFRRVAGAASSSLEVQPRQQLLVHDFLHGRRQVQLGRGALDLAVEESHAGDQLEQHAPSLVVRSWQRAES